MELLTVMVAILCQPQSEADEAQERILILERGLREEPPVDRFRDVFQGMDELRQLYSRASVPFLLKRVSMESVSSHSSSLPMEAARALSTRPTAGCSGGSIARATARTTSSLICSANRFPACGCGRNARWIASGPSNGGAPWTKTPQTDGNLAATWKHR